MAILAEVSGRYDWVPDTPWFLLVPAALFAAAFAVKWWKNRQRQR